METGPKSRSRRQEIRKNRPDVLRPRWPELKEKGIPQSVALAAVFFVMVAAILLLRQDVLPYRSGQPINHDIVSRVGFPFADKNQLAEEQRRARDREPRVYAAQENVWAKLEEKLLAVPAKMSAALGEATSADLLAAFKDPGVRTLLRDDASPQKRKADGSLTAAGLYDQSVRTLIHSLADYRNPAAPDHPLLLLAPKDWRAEVGPDGRRNIRIGSALLDVSTTYAVDDRQELPGIVRSLVEKAAFPSGPLQIELTDYLLSQLQPTHLLDEAATTERGNQQAAAVALMPDKANRQIFPNQILVSRTSVKPTLDDNDVLLLRAENSAYVSSLSGSAWKPKLGTTGVALIVTAVMAAYVAAFQTRIVKNHARAGAIMALLLAMLLLAALAGIGNGPIYLFGVGPTLLVAMILAIAYDRRFAIGIASLHGLLVTVALDQSVAFFLVLWVGVLTAGFMLDDVRTRSKLIEIGGAASLVMIVATLAAGLLDLESGNFVLRNCLFAGAGGLAAGFVVLGTLPFVEKTFRITTSMTLLELADASQPLLRRLQSEAPGTYNHSLQVATLAETAAESIGGNSLLCRVAAYYHDIGKMNKPDYFVENQSDGPNRHINLDPNLSLLIIVGHVKDGVELGHEYNLPTSIIPFIQQHHGTTVVEYFFRRACNQQEQRDPRMAVSDSQYRYPGPRPRTKEVAIVMLADAVESATRAMDEPTHAQIERLVNDIALKRLLDGQFDESDLTMRDLDRVKRSLVKTLAGIYHGRIPYPTAADSATIVQTPATPRPDEGLGAGMRSA